MQVQRVMPVVYFATSTSIDHEKLEGGGGHASTDILPPPYFLYSI
jgi:hypothetical protein